MEDDGSGDSVPTAHCRSAIVFWGNDVLVYHACLCITTLHYRSLFHEVGGGGFQYGGGK